MKVLYTWCLYVNKGAGPGRSEIACVLALRSFDALSNLGLSS